MTNVKAVATRYKDEKQIAGWILGNEYGYLGIVSARYDGYDPSCQAAFRAFLQTKYNTITDLNTVWGTSYADFQSIEMPLHFDPNSPRYVDLLLWRRKSMANFIALGTYAVRTAGDTHLTTYSKALMYNSEDWTSWSESGKEIIDACASSGYPMDFLTFNQFPIPGPGNELRGLDWAVKYLKWHTGVPVMLSEMGVTTYETV